MDPNQPTQAQEIIPQPAIPPVPEQSLEPKPKLSKWALVVVVIGFLIIASGSTAYFLSKNQTTETQNPRIATNPTSIPGLSSTLSPTFSPAPAKQVLPIPIIREVNTNIKNWKTFKDSRGYQINYPEGWFINETYGEVSQIQNWDPSKVKNPGAPLSGLMSKWDVNFSLQNFTSIDNLLQNQDVVIEKIEKSKTSNLGDIYFAIGTSSFFGDESRKANLVISYIVKNDKYFAWHAYYSGEDNLEILKVIVENIY
jgi:hypothetical protein